jgi:hypothetical protein
MAHVFPIPDTVPCRVCGEPRKVTPLRETVMPTKVVADFRIELCEAWCRLLAEHANEEG